MKCRFCNKNTDDVIVMNIMRFKNGELHSYANCPVVLCMDCYEKLSMPNKWDEEQE